MKCTIVSCLCLLINSVCFGFSAVDRFSWSGSKKHHRPRRTRSVPQFLAVDQDEQRQSSLYNAEKSASYEAHHAVDDSVQRQVEEYLETRRSQLQIDEYLKAVNGHPTSASIDDKSQKNTNSDLMQQIKDSGIAGIISFGVIQMGFWALSFPLVVFAFYRVTGHFPDFRDSEDLAKLGAESFTFVNIARLAAPFRIGFALSLVPWIQENLIDPFHREQQT
eukprot:scaffold3515_cov126-Cylindrotheca_fusiformis.AAC.48